MKILLVTPQSKDTVLGVIGNYCKRALVNIGVDLEVFDFRASQYLKNPAGSIFKKAVKKICGFPRKRLTFIGSLEQEKMNRALLSRVEEFRPEIMLAVMGETILPATLDKIKEKGVITANWFLDTALDPDRKDFIQKVSSHYDYFFVYDAADVQRYINIGAGCIESVPLACDSTLHKSVSLTPEERKKYGSEVCFVGSMKYKREELLRSLKEFDLAIWGNWESKDPQLLRCYRRRNVYDEEAVKIYNASDIVLDIHMFYGSGRRAFDINPRVYESTACGAFTITNENPYLSALYEIDKEIICYQDGRELKEKISYYLKHPQEREGIARKGQERAHRDHTYEKRLKKIISVISSQKG